MKTFVNLCSSTCEFTTVLSFMQQCVCVPHTRGELVMFRSAGFSGLSNNVTEHNHHASVQEIKQHSLTLWSDSGRIPPFRGASAEGLDFIRHKFAYESRR